MSGLRQTWDLDVLFPGGSQSAAFGEHLTQIDADAERFSALVGQMEAGAAEVAQWADLAQAVNHVTQQLEHAFGYVSCLMAQDVKDEQAKLLHGRLTALHAKVLGVLNRVDALALNVPDEAWDQILQDSRIQPVAFALDELRRKARHKMNAILETLTTDLSVDGFYAWETLFETIVGRLTIPFEGKRLSVGQAANKFSEPDRAMRAGLFGEWKNAWQKESELCASALNALSGYRLAVNKHRGWGSILYEPTQLNRMSEATLDAMWGAIAQGKGRLVDYLNRKAKLLGTEKLSWYDLTAPVGSAQRKLSYDQAAAFITENFRRFSPHMADFAQLAFQEGWIEAEDRAGKAPGGFCTSLPKNEASRIFMTYGGDSGSVRTLAHELGHAYHTYVMRDLPALNQQYAMNVAETASTFAEFLITSAAIKAATTDEERLALLDAKLIEATAYLMNIHARFLFEVEFYEQRRKGPVSHDRLSELMLRAQQEAYMDALDTYDPLFWASKGHFYIAGAPFYNFPYTFGFLFSSGLYARASQEGPAFAERYVALLRDTGRMQVEDLAMKHLDVDLTQPDFWATGVAASMADVDEFLRITQ